MGSISLAGNHQGPRNALPVLPGILRFLAEPYPLVSEPSVPEINIVDFKLNPDGLIPIPRASTVAPKRVQAYLKLVRCENGNILGREVMQYFEA
ncbi:MAG: hypothetical protein AUF79_15370 [Crenarchaeota archaeon 13_1_20CM_2_51_8]|nr:MAG: hypothetical protein AUF79_15370 [Crenarchaeota archaeon 13_1_20CM_2_51_8]